MSVAEGLPDCCRATLADLPEAAFCVTCTRPIVRCTSCGGPTAPTGYCPTCIALVAAMETGLEVSPGLRASVGFKLRNGASSPVWVQRIEWRGAGADQHHVLRVAENLGPGEERACLLKDIDTQGVGRLAIDVAVVAGPSERDLHEIGAKAIDAGVVGTGQDSNGGIRVEGDLVIQSDRGGLSKVVVGSEIPGMQPTATPTAWSPVVLVPSPGRPASPDTPAVDRRLCVNWTNPRTGEEETHHFARRPWMLLGRSQTKRGDTNSGEGVDLRWHPPVNNDSAARAVAQEVSRRHARLEVQFGRLWLVDVGSTNGTCVNEERIRAHEPHELHHGDRIVPWGDVHDPKYAVHGSWQVFFKSGGGRRAEEAVFRYTKE